MLLNRIAKARIKWVVIADPDQRLFRSGHNCRFVIDFYAIFRITSQHIKFIEPNLDQTIKGFIKRPLNKLFSAPLWRLPRSIISGCGMVNASSPTLESANRIAEDSAKAKFEGVS